MYHAFRVIHGISPTSAQSKRDTVKGETEKHKARETKHDEKDVTWTKTREGRYEIISVKIRRYNPRLVILDRKVEIQT